MLSNNHWNAECLNAEIEAVQPKFKAKHVLIPIDVSEGPERSKRPWADHPRVAGNSVLVETIAGALNCIRPGVFVMIACGTHVANKFEVFKMMREEKGFSGADLGWPLETVLVEAEHSVSFGARKNGVSQAKNCETVLTVTAKAGSDMYKLKKKKRLFADQKTSFSCDIAKEVQAPALSLQLNSDGKSQMLQPWLSRNFKWDLACLDDIPEEMDKRKYFKRNRLSNRTRNCFPLVWALKTKAVWMEILNPFVLPKPLKTYVFDILAGGGMKLAAALALPVTFAKAVCLNVQHEQHVLQVADLELVKEFGRQDSYWWMKDSAEEIQGLFEKYFKLQVTEAEEDDSDGSSDE